MENVKRSGNIGTLDQVVVASFPASLSASRKRVDLQSRVDFPGSVSADPSLPNLRVFLEEDLRQLGRIDMLLGHPGQVLVQQVDRQIDLLQHRDQFWRLVMKSLGQPYLDAD